jgi:methyl-accepting chemotaxis protein PixJ
LIDFGYVYFGYVYFGYVYFDSFYLVPASTSFRCFAMQPNGSAHQPNPKKGQAAITPAAADASQHSVPLPPPVKGRSLRPGTKVDGIPQPTWQAFPDSQKMMMGWHLKAMLSAMAIAAVPLMGLGGFAYVWTNQSIAEANANQQQTLATKIATDLTQLLSERLGDVQQLAGTSITQDARLSLVEKQRLLDQQKANAPIFKSLAILDMNGQPKVQTSGSTLENQASQVYFREALQNNRPVVLPMAGNMAVMAVPTVDAATNKPTGMVVAHLQLELVQKQWSISLGEQIAIADTTGKIFLATNPAHGNQTIEQAFPGSAELIANGTPMVSQRLKLGLSNLGLKEGEKNDQIFGTAPITASKEGQPLTAQVMVAGDVEMVLQQQRDRSVQLGLGLLVLLGSTGLVALILSRRTGAMVSQQVDELENQYRSLEVRQQRSLERSQWLGQMIETMRQSMGEMALLNTTVTELRYALNADRVMFYRCNDDWSGTIVAESVGSNYRKFVGQTVHDLFREGAIERYQDGQVQVIPDVSRLGVTRAHRDNLEKLSIKASLIAPVMQHGKLIGLLCSHQCASVRNWEQEDIDLFAKLSSQLAFVLEQSAVMTRQ